MSARDRILRLSGRADNLPAGRAVGLGVGAGVALGAGAAFGGWAGMGAGLAFGALAARWGLSGSARLAPAPPARPVVDALDLPEHPELEMVALRGGRFLMQAQAREVEVGRFWIQKVPVTRALYAALTGADPGWGPPTAPANEVSWYEAVRFCNALSHRARRTPCYQIRDEHVTWTMSADGYRLPTEAEWELAIRAGTTTEYFFRWRALASRYAWFGEPAGGPRPVGTKKANPWGLHDMAGNVWEWCWDAARARPDEVVEYVTREAFADNPPVGVRVLRGGSFDDPAWVLGSAVRSWFPPVFRDGIIGFRCVRGPLRQPRASILDP